MQKIFILLMVLLSAVTVQAKPRDLTEVEISRVKASKELIKEVDNKTFQKTVDELQKSAYPEVNVAIMEAMAQAYSEIVKEQDARTKSQKDWLYSMIALNMAYLQFGGSKPAAGKNEALNKIIVQKLKRNLPEDLMKNPGFFYKADW